MGLNHLQEIAQLAQTDDGEHWENQIENWIKQIQKEWKDNLQELKWTIEKND